jgi:hypothetical protein
VKEVSMLEELFSDASSSIWDSIGPNIATFVSMSGSLPFLSISARILVDAELSDLSFRASKPDRSIISKGYNEEMKNHYEPYWTNLAEETELDLGVEMLPGACDLACQKALDALASIFANAEFHQ